MDQSLLYRSLLRVSAVVTACVLVFQAGLIDERSATVFSQAGDSLAAMTVGATASVAPNEFNQITAELTRQEQLLQAREAEITSREIELGLQQGEPAVNQTTTYLIAAILFIQLVLLVLNYALDYLRARERQGVGRSTQVGGI